MSRRISEEQGAGELTRWEQGISLTVGIKSWPHRLHGGARVERQEGANSTVTAGDVVLARTGEAVQEELESASLDLMDEALEHVVGKNSGR